MKRSRLISLFMVIILILSCNSGIIKIKPQPAGDNWEICTICKGGGTVEVYDSGASFKYADPDEGKFYGCFLPSYGNFETGEPYSGPFDKEDYKKLKNENSPAERSVVKRKAKCPGCSGSGWIEKSEENPSWNYKKDKYNELNSIINKKSNP